VVVVRVAFFLERSKNVSTPLYWTIQSRFRVSELIVHWHQYIILKKIAQRNRSHSINEENDWIFYYTTAWEKDRVTNPSAITAGDIHTYLGWHITPCRCCYIFLSLYIMWTYFVVGIIEKYGQSWSDCLLISGWKPTWLHFLLRKWRKFGLR